MKAELRQLVWSRSGGCCEYCRVPQQFDPLPFQVDHIIARQHRGATTPDNLALTCYACNHHKGPNIAGFDEVFVIDDSAVPPANGSMVAALSVA